MPAPTLIKPIHPQITNERAAFGPFNLKEYIQSPEGTNLRFSAGLKDGRALPTGLICTGDGIITGIPGKETQGTYEVIITATNNDGTTETEFVFTIKPSMSGSTNYSDQLKTQVWQALAEHLPIPDLAELYDRPISIRDIYYLWERWGILTIWDAFNL